MEDQEEIRKARDEWERTFDSITDVVTIQDTNFQIIRCNKPTLQVLQTTKDQVIGRKCHEVFHADLSPCADCPVSGLPENFKNYSIEITHPNLGKTFLVSASPIFAENGKEIVGVVHFAKDISEQKILEQKLRQAVKMEAIGTLAGGIAHDFNNILTAILGYSDMVRKELPPTSQAFSDIQQVYDAGIRAKELVQHILTISRQREKLRQPIQIQYSIKEALKLLRASISTSIEITQNINQDCPNIIADPTEIHQVIMNLCTNAYHAMKEKGGTLDISLKTKEIEPYNPVVKRGDIQPGSYVELMVSDTGCGIAKENMSRIFEPYFTTKKQGEGTGLGLAVIFGIVKNSGGHIFVSSVVGDGTVFTIYFPVAKEIAATDMDFPAKDSPIPHGSENILVLDDEKTIVTLMKRMLERLGYKATPFTSPNAALEAFKGLPGSFDLVISDMQMPEMEGMDFAKKVMEIRPKIPVIIFTGFSDKINKEKAKQLGIKGFLFKPITERELAMAVKKAFAMPPLSAEKTV